MENNPNQNSNLQAEVDQPEQPKYSALVPLSGGRIVDIFNLKKTDIRIEDIARALSRECRFSNHTDSHYSVAEHSVYTSFMAPKMYAIYYLLHDALETYWRDMSGPFKAVIKQAWPEYSYWERKNEQVIIEALGLSYNMFCKLHGAIKEADRYVLKLEKDIQIDRRIVSLTGTPLEGMPFGMPPETAEQFFLQNYREYTE